MDTMAPRPRLYAYDPTTGEARGETRPELDVVAIQMAAGDAVPIRWIAPAFTTEAPPPPAAPGQVAIFASGAWVLVADHRGEVWYSGETPVRIETIGDPGAAGLTREPPPPPPPPPVDELAQLRRTLGVRMQELCSRGATFVAIRQPVPDYIVSEIQDIDARLQKLDQAQAGSS